MDTPNLSRDYEDDERVKQSLIPLIDKAIDEMANLFCDAKSKVASTNNIWKSQLNKDDFQVEFVDNLNINSLLYDSPESLREMVQTYADKAAYALKEAAKSSQKNLNFQSQLHATQVANCRLTNVVTDIEKKLAELMENLNSQEEVRINFTRDLKQLNDESKKERISLSKKLSTAQDTIAQLKTDNQKLENQHAESTKKAIIYENRAQEATEKAEMLKTKLDEALARENITETALRKTQHELDKVKAELLTERSEAAAKMNKAVRDGKEALGEKERVLMQEIQSYKEEIAGLHSSYSKELKDNFSKAKEAIARLTIDMENLDASRMKYYQLYKNLLEDLNNHKQQITADVIKRAYANLKGEFESNQRQAGRVRQALKNMEMNTRPNFGTRCYEAMQSSTSSSDLHPHQHRKENLSPTHRREPVQHQRTNAPKSQFGTDRTRKQAARSYSVTGRFPSTRH